MARLGLGRKREEEEQARQAMSEQEAAVVEGARLRQKHGGGDAGDEAPRRSRAPDKPV